MKDDGRIPRIKDTDMTDRLLTAGAIAEDTRNPIGDIAHASPVTAARASACSTAACPASPKPSQVIAPRRPAFPRHVLARWQSQCGGTSHHTHRGAVQEPWLDLRPHPSWDGAGTYGPDGVFHP